MQTRTNFVVIQKFLARAPLDTVASDEHRGSGQVLILALAQSNVSSGYPFA